MYGSLGERGNMNLQTVLYEVVDGVAVVTLNRPEAMNAWTPQLSDELTIAMGMADTDDTVQIGRAHV